MLERTLSKFNSMDSTQSPSSVCSVPGSNKSHADSIVSSFFSFSDSSPISVSSSFDRVIEKALASVLGDESVKDRLIDRTLELTSLLLDSTKRCFRKRARAHNSTSWFLPSELTVKVFSMLDTNSLMQAATCCTMFNKCAMEPLCYSHIDLSTSANYADDDVVCTMIHRAGKELRSLKVGRAVFPPRSNLATSCLKPLADNHGFIGSHLRSLRLYNLNPLSDRYSLCDALLVCSNITELKIVGLCDPSEELFKSLTGKCRFIEHLLLEISYPARRTASYLVEFLTNCPNLTSVTLIRFGLNDELAQILAKSCHKLTYLNLSRSIMIKGRFLRDLALSSQESPLKTLILRNCPVLREKEVLDFCNSLLTGNCKSIRHIDVSSNCGFASGGSQRCKKPNFPVERLKEERSDLTFVAKFPIRSSVKCYRVCDEEDLKLIDITEAENHRFYREEEDSPSEDSDFVADGEDVDEDDVSLSDEEDMEIHDDYLV